MGKLHEVASALKHMHDTPAFTHMHDDDAASCMEKAALTVNIGTLKYLPIRILFRHFVRLQIFGFLLIVSVMCSV